MPIYYIYICVCVFYTHTYIYTCMNRFTLK